MASTPASSSPSRLLNGASNPHIRLARVLMTLAAIPVSYAAPLFMPLKEHGGDELKPKPADDPNLWIYLGTAVALVVIGGVFAGLTIACV
jgi:metal transporter CNNM